MSLAVYLLSPFKGLLVKYLLFLPSLMWVYRAAPMSSDDMKCKLSFLLEWRNYSIPIFYPESLCNTFYVWKKIIWSFICWYENIFTICRSDGHAFTSAFCNTLPAGCLKFCFSLEVRSSIWPFTISFQDETTESSTISSLAHCNAYWSAASRKSDKFLSQSTVHGSMYFGPFAIRSLNLEFGRIERSPVTTWPYG